MIGNQRGEKSAATWIALRARRLPRDVCAVVSKLSFPGALIVGGWFGIFGLVGASFAETPSDVLASAFKNRQQATAESAQAEISFAGSKRELSYVREGKDKLAIKVATAQGGTTEITVVGKSVYVRKDGGSWSRSDISNHPPGDAAPPATSMPALSNLAESSPIVIAGRRQRVFTGDGDWVFGNTKGIGNWKLTIDATTVLPTQVEFSGKCSDQACSFVQKSSYGPGPSVSAPALDAGSVSDIIYRIGPNGSAGFFARAGIEGQPGRLNNAGTVRSDLSNAVASSGAVGVPVVYGRSVDGSLSWRGINPAPSGKFAETASLTVDKGWSKFSEIAAGENGVIYGRYPIGYGAPHAFRWRRHLGYLRGLDKWNSLTSDVGDTKEWGQYLKVFCGSKGAVYGILPNGDLMWHRHDGYLDGQDKWSAEILRVGHGWSEMRAVASVGDGVIYAVNKAGQLIWMRHRGYLTGEDLWDGPITIANDWKDTVTLFAFRSP
jgi:hypothetical protein